RGLGPLAECLRMPAGTLALLCRITTKGRSSFSGEDNVIALHDGKYQGKAQGVLEMIRSRMGEARPFANPEECNEWFLSRLEELEGCDPGRAQAVEDAVWNY